MGLYDADPTKVIEKTAAELKKVIKMPEWGLYVKTGHGKERAPENPDWWYIRAAAVLRKIYIGKPVGTNKLAVKFGNKKNKGVKPERFVRASRKVIRVILQQLEKEGLVKQVEKGVHKGRKITPKGVGFLDKISNTIKNE